MNKSLFAVSLLIIILGCSTSCSKSGYISGGTKLFVPPGQVINGAIQERDGQTYYSVDTVPLVAYGGSPISGYTWNVATGSTLPAGTTVDPLTGIFHFNGGALVPGTSKFKMIVSDGSLTATGEFTFIAAKGEILPVATFQQSNAFTVSLPDAKEGDGYGASLRAFGNGELPWRWTLASGSLPQGLVIDPSTGVVRGTPMNSAGGTHEFIISVTDKNGKEAISITPEPPKYVIKVAP